MTIEQIQQQIRARRFSVKSHVISHMLEEGFESNHCQEAALSGRVLEEYPEEKRCLILGYFHFTSGVTCPLHVVCDYSDPDKVDFVTAYIPQRPWWEAPDRRGDY